MVALGAAGCFGNETTALPPGLQPLEEVTVAPPDPVDGDPHPEALRMESGMISAYDWVQARGYVKAPLSAVYLAMQTPEVVVDHREVDRWSVMHASEPEYDRVFVVHNEVDDIITVEFDLTWRFGITEGNDDAPREAVATWQKTWGTTFISILRGSVVAREVAPGVTEVAIVEHINAAERGPETIEPYIRDYFANLVEVSHGRPVPTY